MWRAKNWGGGLTTEVEGLSPPLPLTLTTDGGDWRSYTVVSVQHCSSGMCDTVICDGDCWWVWRRSLYWWMCCMMCCHWRCRMSALHQAALIGNIDIMRLLLEHGAVVDIADSKSKSPVTHSQQKLVSSTSYHSPSSLFPSFPLQHSFIFTFSNTFVLLQYYVTILFLSQIC